MRMQNFGYILTTVLVLVLTFPRMNAADFEFIMVQVGDITIPIFHPYDLDRDCDGVTDDDDLFPDDPLEWADLDIDGIGDNSDNDIDGDGVVNISDAFIHDATEWADLDGDGIGDNADTDDDGDGIPDEVDPDPVVFTTAGTLNGNFQVANGSANYTVPIEIPPGMAGMQPSLALTYSSGGDNGPLGMGWGLSGLSTITRCGTTLAQDGFIDGVDFDDNDKFCLDGERLVTIHGVYGADGTEYRTEKESFSKIISYGQVGSGPSYFKVWTKSGQVKNYGETGDSRIEAQGRADVSVWALNRVTDASNNTIDFNYYEDNLNGYYRIDRIDYTGNVIGGLEPFASVRFQYEGRPDVTTGYVAGSKTSVLERLTHVKTFFNEQMVRDYALEYEENVSTGRSRLIKLSECDGAQLCKLPSEFSYTTSTVEFSQYINPIEQAYVDGNPDDALTADFNGDGIADIYFIWRTNGTNRLYLSDGNGGFSQYINPIEQAYVDGNPDDALTADFNGDGIADIYFI